MNIPSDSYTSDDASSVASERPIVRPPRRIRCSKPAATDFQSLADRLQYKSRRVSRRQNQREYLTYALFGCVPEREIIIHVV